MKAAFIGFDDIDTEQIKRLLGAEEVIKASTAFEVIGQYQGEGHLYAPSEMVSNSGAQINAARSAGMQVYALDKLPPEDSRDDLGIKLWLGLSMHDPEEDDSEVVDDLSPEQSETPSTTDGAPRRVIDTEPASEIPPQPAQAPAAPPVQDANSGNPTQDRLNRLRARGGGKPRSGGVFQRAQKGLAHKVEVTPDMLRLEDHGPVERKEYEPYELGYLLTITSGFGGGGKTTLAYYSAQIMSRALEFAKNDRTKVVLIEADYGNPKLQNRLRIPMGHDLSRLANFLESVDKGEIPAADVPLMAERIMNEIIFQDPDSGMMVIACPYEKYTADAAYIKQAVKKAVLWAQRTMGYFVVLDCDTIGHPEGINLDLMEMANRIVIVTNTKEPKVLKPKRFWRAAEYEAGNPNDRSHIDDAIVMIQGFTRPKSQHGFGLPGDKIRVFFNETTAEDLQSKVLSKNYFPKNMVIGNLPIIPEIQLGWAADLGRNINRSNEVAKAIAYFLLRVTGYREVDQFRKKLDALA